MQNLSGFDCFHNVSLYDLFYSNRGRITPALFTGKEEQHVTSLPFDIDGDQVFKMKYNADSPASTLSDGRPWNAYYNSKRSGFSGIRRRATCKGSQRCTNEMCWYRKKYGKANQVNFEKQNGVSVCHSCHAVPEDIPCPAIKVWEVSEDKAEVTIYHYGMHTCVAVNKSISSSIVNDAAQSFQTSRQLKPERYVNDKIIAAIETSSSADDVYKIASSLTNNSKLNNIKAKARAEINVAGHNFDAVGKYKESVCRKLEDPYLIYKVNNKALDATRPSFVFKSSKEQLQIAIDMDREGDNLLREEYCHLDGNHKRCAGYTTITLWMYHPYLRNMNKIATMEVETESKSSMGIFWDTLNEAIKEFTGNPNARFRPHGYMMDESGGFWASIANVQGEEDLQRSVSCEKHFDFTVKRHEKSLPGEDLKSEFRYLCKSVLTAETPLVYEKAAERMDDFVAAHNHLVSWWDWWQKRKSHVFRAFKPLHNTPKANHAEVGHSRWVKVGAVNLTLVDACREDVAESVKLSATLRAYGTGVFRGGGGPSAADLQRRRYAEQTKRADAYIDELNKIAQTSTSNIRTRETESFVDPTSSHRHDPPGGKAAKSARTAPYRPQRSKSFLRSMDIAKKCKKSFTVQNTSVTKEKVQIGMRHSSGKYNNVTISKYPDCAECAYCTKQNLCSHIIWAYLFVCNMPESSPILQQRALSTEELTEVISSLKAASTASNPLTSPSTSTGAPCSNTRTGSKTDWELDRYEKARGKRAQCRKCKNNINDGSLVIVANGMWSPPHLNSKGEKFYIPSKFYFCLNGTCCHYTPIGSSIHPPDQINISEAILEGIKPEEYEIICSLGLPFIWS